MNMTKDSIRGFRADFAEAVKDLEKKYKVQVKIGNVKFSATNFYTKMEVVSNEQAHVELVSSSKNEEANIFATVNGIAFAGNFIGSRYSIGPKTYKVTGMTPRRCKYPIIAQCLEDGKSYKMSSYTFRGVILQGAAE